MLGPARHRSRISPLATANFTFHGNLAEFLPHERRRASFEYVCARAATLKNAIESLGVPHTEAAQFLVNGVPATLNRIVRDGDFVEVHAWIRQAVPVPLKFIADAHLGGLARFLRMLGYDTLHENAIPDDEIRRLAHEERRIVLTRDRELLKCREIFFGCYVHALKPAAQLCEVAARFDLSAHARPFTLCLRCNLPLDQATEQQVRAYAPEPVLEIHRVFHRCAGCARIYWEGSHFARMKAVLQDTLGFPPPSATPPQAARMVE